MSNSLGKNYGTISHAFSSEESTTIEKYAILLRVEYIKAQLEYDELSLSEIATRLQYSSLSHLSKQFKGVTGITPSEYKKVLPKSRRPLNMLI
ncbi:AraC family transcriptional regulator [Rufibacter sp. LB8]|uniref:helix-turn-helix domain-containing protein n=1 Tax=Rufibacter sp. LB8 TaxID=2777781 RepID=UPI00178C4B16